MTNFDGFAETTTDELVVRAKADREAFGALYDRCFPLVYRYCQRRLFDLTAAEDVASDVILHVARSMRRFPGTTETDFRCWLYRIATNAVNAHVRKQKRRAELFRRAVDLGRIAPAGAASSASCSRWDEVARPFAELTPRDQALLTLRYMEELSYEEMAEILKMRTTSVRVAVGRALGNLRQNVAARGELPTDPH